MRRFVVVLLMFLLLLSGCSDQTVSAKVYKTENVKIHPDYSDKFLPEYAVELVSAYILAAGVYNLGVFTNEDLEAGDASIIFILDESAIEAPPIHRGDDKTVREILNNCVTHIMEMRLIFANGRHDAACYQLAHAMDDLGLTGNARIQKSNDGSGLQMEETSVYLEKYTARRVELEEWLDTAMQWLIVE